MRGHREEAGASVLRLRCPSVEIAVVHAAGIISHVAVACDRETLYQQLAPYVDEQARYQLPREDEEAVRILLRRGRWEVAVERYFSSVDGRWDPEQLHRVRLPLPGHDEPEPAA